jgi:hypothetical protein
MTARPEDEITKYIARFANPPAEQVREFAAAARTSLIAKGGFLVELGDASHPLYFVHSGAIRYMLILPESGDDVTKDFSFAPAFAASFGSAVSGQPARVGIAAITDCVVSSWPLQRLTALYDVDAEWQKALCAEGGPRDCLPDPDPGTALRCICAEISRCDRASAAAPSGVISRYHARIAVAAQGAAACGLVNRLCS